MVVVIGQRAASDDDDGECDSNSANVDLAVITQSVAVPSQGERKKRSPPSCGLRPECSDLQQPSSHWHKLGKLWEVCLGRQELNKKIVP